MDAAAAAAALEAAGSPFEGLEAASVAAAGQRVIGDLHDAVHTGRGVAGEGREEG